MLLLLVNATLLLLLAHRPVGHGVARGAAGERGGPALAAAAVGNRNSILLLFVVPVRASGAAEEKQFGCRRGGRRVIGVGRVRGGGAVQLVVGRRGIGRMAMFVVVAVAVGEVELMGNCEC